MLKQTIRDVQIKILEIMKYIDAICRENGIVYFIMGGTALGAVRHGGFIPWDDDLDIFMKPADYSKFKADFEILQNKQFALQEWRTTPDYLEYAKVRMMGTTFIEENFKDRKDMHHGIYVDIMILHKCPARLLTQKKLFYECKYVTLLGLSQRNWKPKSQAQKLLLNALRLLPNKLLSEWCYTDIYRYDDKALDNYMYFYWITPAGFKQGLFETSMFEYPVDVAFEDTKLMGSRSMKKYLEYRYGDYMKLPEQAARKAAVHAKIYDTEKGYETYI